MTLNEIKVEVLRAARVLIERSETEFVCHALSYGARKRGRVPEGAQLKRLIESRLAGFATLDAWIMACVGHADYSRGGSEKMRATRLAWIDSLIVEHGGAL